MRKMMAAGAVAGPRLLGIGVATPALAQAAPGTFTFTVHAAAFANPSGPAATGTYSIQVAPPRSGSRSR